MIKVSYPCESRKITSPYGPRPHIGDGFHDGTDFACSMKSNIFSVYLGKVVKIGCQEGGYGHYVVVQHDGFYSVYAHLHKVLVSVGQTVKQGEVIALSGNSGKSSGPHLHLEIRIGIYSSSTYKLDYKGRYLNSIDAMLVLNEDDWQVKQGKNALKELQRFGLINDVSEWQNNMKEPLPAWIVWEILNRVRKELP